MTDAKLINLILQKCDQISREQQKLKTDIHTLISIQGATTAELNMLKERFDLATNADFLKDTTFLSKEGKK